MNFGSKKTVNVRRGTLRCYSNTSGIGNDNLNSTVQSFDFRNSNRSLDRHENVSIPRLKLRQLPNYQTPRISTRRLQRNASVGDIATGRSTSRRSVMSSSRSLTNLFISPIRSEQQHTFFTRDSKSVRKSARSELETQLKEIQEKLRRLESDADEEEQKMENSVYKDYKMDDNNGEEESYNRGEREQDNNDEREASVKQMVEDRQATTFFSMAPKSTSSSPLFNTKSKTTSPMKEKVVKEKRKKLEEFQRKQQLKDGVNLPRLYTGCAGKQSEPKADGLLYAHRERFVSKGPFIDRAPIHGSGGSKGPGLGPSSDNPNTILQRYDSPEKERKLEEEEKLANSPELLTKAATFEYDNGRVANRALVSADSPDWFSSAINNNKDMFEHLKQSEIARKYGKKNLRNDNRFRNPIVSNQSEQKTNSHQRNLPALNVNMNSTTKFTKVKKGNGPSKDAPSWMNTTSNTNSEGNEMEKTNLNLPPNVLISKEAPAWMQQSSIIEKRKEKILERVAQKEQRLQQIFRSFNSRSIPKYQFRKALKDIGFVAKTGEVDFLCNMFSQSEDNDSVHLDLLNTTLRNRQGYTTAGTPMSLEKNDKLTSHGGERKQQKQQQRGAGNPVMGSHSIVNKLLSTLHQKYGEEQTAKAFRRFDKNQDHTIDQTELLMGIGMLGYDLKKEDKAALTSFFMDNPNQKISYNQFASKVKDNIKEKDFERGGKIHNVPSISKAHRYSDRLHQDAKFFDNTNSRMQKVNRTLNTSRREALHSIATKILNKYGPGNTKDAFFGADIDRSGKLSKKEFQNTIQRLGVNVGRPEMESICELFIARGGKRGEQQEIDYATFADYVNDFDTEVDKGELQWEKETIHNKPSLGQARRTSFLKQLDARNEKTAKFNEQQQKMFLNNRQQRLLKDISDKLHSKYGSKNITRAFRKFDTDGSGSISSEEFHHALETLGFQITSQDMNALSELFLSVDRNGKNRKTINYRNFARYVKPVEKGLADKWEQGEGYLAHDSTREKEFDLRQQRIIAERDARRETIQAMTSKEKNRLRSFFQKLDQKYGQGSSHRIFRNFDEDHNSLLSLKEFTDKVRHLDRHLTNEDITSLAKFVGFSNDRKSIDFNAFATRLNDQSILNELDDSRTSTQQKEALKRRKKTISMMDSLPRRDMKDVSSFMTNLRLRYRNPKDVFRKLDEDHDGKLSLAEIKKGIARIAHVDPNQSTGIDVLVRTMAEGRKSTGNDESIYFDDFVRCFNYVTRKVEEFDGIGRVTGTTARAEKMQKKRRTPRINPLQHLIANLGHKCEKEKILEEFRKYDKGGIGTIPADKLRYCLHDLGIEPYSASIDKVCAFVAKQPIPYQSLVDNDPHLSSQKQKSLLKNNNRFGKTPRRYRPDASGKEKRKRKLLNDLLVRCGNVTKAFRRFDQDKDGVVDRAEFLLGLTTAGFDPTSDASKELLHYADR
eukprot:g40.t1